jgi:O-antigen/teichoic acid export membrane protein
MNRILNQLNLIKKNEISRNLNIKLAISTSLASKLSTIFLQIFVIPIGIRILGVEKFGVYASITASLSWISLLGLGIGPGLTSSIASLNCKDQQEEEKEYFSTAFYLSLVISMFIILSIKVIETAIPFNYIFGKYFLKYSQEINQGISLLGIIIAMQFFLSVFEAANSGYQKQHVNNTWNILGNVCSAFGILFLIHKWPSIYMMILVIFGIPLIGKIINGIFLIFYSKKYLLPWLKYFNSQKIKYLLNTGFLFMIIQMSGLINQQFSILIVSNLLGPTETGIFAVILQIFTMAGGIVAMITQPIWPALMEAYSINDIQWIQKCYKNLLTFSLCYSCIAAILLTIGGKSILEYWLGSSIDLNSLIGFAIGTCFIVTIFCHIHTTFLMGMMDYSFISKILLTESIINIPISIFLIQKNGLLGMIESMTLSKAIISSIALYLRSRKKLALSTK